MYGTQNNYNIKFFNIEIDNPNQRNDLLRIKKYCKINGERKKKTTGLMKLIVLFI